MPKESIIKMYFLKMPCFEFLKTILGQRQKIDPQEALYPLYTSSLAIICICTSADAPIVVPGASSQVVWCCGLSQEIHIKRLLVR